MVGIVREYQEDGSHRCEEFKCSNSVPYDDEPYCFEHSPDTGSHLFGYSYKKDNLSTTLKNL